MVFGHEMAFASGFAERYPVPIANFFSARARVSRSVRSARGVRVQAWIREMTKGLAVVLRGLHGVEAGRVEGREDAEEEVEVEVGGEEMEGLDPLSLNIFGEVGRPGQRVRDSALLLLEDLDERDDLEEWEEREETDSGRG